MKTTPHTGMGRPFLLPVGSVKPRGWIRAQMLADLHDGLKGNFPKITRNVAQNLFATQGRRPGTWTEGARGHQEKAWWAGEHEGYWIDSIARSAILLGDEKFLAVAAAWVEGVLAKFAESRYIGIYAPEARFPEKGFDGELWTQSRAFQALLAWHEHTGDDRILEAVDATVRLTIGHYREKGTYFGRPDADGGTTHGVGYMDTLEWLHRLTGDPWFAEAAAWLYRDYSDHAPETFRDLAARNLADPGYPWFDHGAHVGEALHLPRIAHAFSGDAAFGRAAAQVLPKLFRHTNPAGGIAIGHLEAVAGVRGGGHRLNENCAHIEALMSLNRLFQYEPDPAIGDWQERCIFNVVQGARLHPADRAVTYLSRDNRRHAADPAIHGGRELFSACHEAAACCVLNVPRAMPYYVEGMWYRLDGRPGLLANGYGPCRLETEIGGTRVCIEEATDYPFSGAIAFRFELPEPVAFELVLRIPPGGGRVGCDVGADAAVANDGRLLRIEKTWRDGDTLKVDFHFEPQRLVQPDGREACWRLGPLVFALPFEHRTEVRAPVDADGESPSGFYEYLLRPVESAGWELLAGVDSSFRAVQVEGDRQFPWTAPPVALDGTLTDREGRPVGVRLVPMGSAPLRRTTFPFHAIVPADPDGETNHVTADDDPMRAF